MWLGWLKSIVQLLHSDISPRQVAGAVGIGVIIGLTPGFTLQSLILFLLLFFLKVNPGSGLLASALVTVVSPVTDRFADKIGYALLVDTHVLYPFWTRLYNMPVVPFTKFYNTVVLGAFVLGLLLFAPVYWLTIRAIEAYRARWRDRLNKMKPLQAFKATSAYQWYERLKG